MESPLHDDGGVADASSPIASLQRRRKSRALRLSDGSQSEVQESLRNEVDPPDCITRASWFQDAFQQQGMSEEELQNFLQDEQLTPTEGECEFDTGGLNFPMDEIAEQHKFMAIHEAKKLLDEAMGYDVAEAAKKLIAQDNEEEKARDVLPSTTYYCSPEKPPYTIGSKTNQGQRSSPRRRMQPKFDVPGADASSYDIPGRAPPRRKIVYGAVVENSEDNWNTGMDGEDEENDMILSHCERCKVLLAVPLKAILAVCPKCDDPIH